MSLNNIKSTVFYREKERVLCEVRTAFLYIIFRRFPACFSLGPPNTAYELSALMQRYKLYRKSPQNAAPPHTKFSPNAQNSFLSYIIKQSTSHHLTSFHFSTLYVASSLFLPEGQAGTAWETCPPRNNKRIAPNYTPLFVSPVSKG